MARLWQSGFESNNTAADGELTITSGTVSIVTSPTRTGTYALRTNPTASSAFARQHVAGSNQSTQIWMRVYLRVASLPVATTSVIRIANGSNGSCAQLLLSSTGGLILNDAANTTIGSPSATLSTGVWYLVELGLDASTNPGTVSGRLDGVTFASGANSAQSPWARFLVGVIGSTTGDLYWDDWAINDSSGTRQNTWPGPGGIIHLLPIADGDNHAWLDTAAAAGTTNNYTLVNEVTPNDATNLVQSVTLNAEDMYNMSNSGIGPASNIACVMVGVRYRNNTADAVTAFRVQAKKTSGGTIGQSSSIIPNSTTWVTNANAEPRNYPLVLHTDPDGIAWNPNTLDSMQAGVKLTAAGTNRVQVTAVWVSVDYAPGKSPAGLSQYGAFF